LEEANQCLRNRQAENDAICQLSVSVWRYQQVCRKLKEDNS